MERIDYEKVDNKAMRATLGFEDDVSRCGNEAPLLELAPLRASQINGCVYRLEN
ncbi:MAG TPA: hypothetical protein VG324_28290 [Blastocatellia bacterium]|nr:hypothetical protein [Blastocatellia bacterium]